jgi:GNAT-family acetyltransferase (TIGR03103 family)
VKLARGEQGNGVSVGVSSEQELEEAIERASHICEDVLLEAYKPGLDLRVVLIDDQVVAAAVRKPAEIVGNGVDTVETLIRKQSRRRAAATGGESHIPMDEETQRCLNAQEVSSDSVPESGRVIRVRETANLHTGGTLHDVTDELHHELVRASEHAARALNIPVVGLDLIVQAPDQAEYWIIEANERPGLANHEPQPTAQRFIDFLFPQTIA